MKNNKTTKNAISLKTALYKNKIKSLKPQIINIQTIIKPKNNSIQIVKEKKIKKLLEPNEINDNSFISNEINKKKKIVISNSLNNSMYTYKKRKYKRNKIISKKKYHKKNQNSSNSIKSIKNFSINSSYNNNLNNNLNNYYSSSFSISNNSKNKYSNYSSSSHYSSNSDCSSSSETSYNSIGEFKKAKFFSMLITKDHKLDNLTKKEVGIISSDDEDNNINEENNDNYQNNNNSNNILQQKYSEEIERILIDIYNKNISIINSKSVGSPISKQLFETNTMDIKKLKKLFRKQNPIKNILALKILSDKIKCLIEKCKEKIYEIDDIKKIYEQFIRDNNKRYCNSFGSSGLTTNSNSSSYYGSGSDDENYYIRNSLLLNNIQDEAFCKDISQDLLTQLINIKNTLKASSKEIENVFKYSFNSLKTSDRKKAKINIELMQLEQYNKVILNDDLISTLLIQIKFVFSKYKEDYIVQIIDQLQQESLLHKNSMTNFDNLIAKNLEIISNEYYKNNLLNEKIDDEKEEILDNKNDYNNEIIDKNDINKNSLNLENSSFNEEENIEENNSINQDNSLIAENNNIIKIPKNDLYEVKDNKENSTNDDYHNENISFDNIDDLVKFINEDNNDANQNYKNKKHKKRNKKKKKKKNNDIFIEKEKNKNIEINNNKNDISLKEDKNDEDDDDIIKSFKEDIIKNSIYNYEIIKIKPKIPDNYPFDKLWN